MNLEQAWKDRLGDKYSGEFQADNDAPDDGNMLAIPLPQVAYAATNISTLYNDSKQDGTVEVFVSIGDQLEVDERSGGLAKVRLGSCLGWVEESHIQSAAPANTMFIDFGEDVPEARDASCKKITPPDQGIAVSVGKS